MATIRSFRPRRIWRRIETKGEEGSSGVHLEMSGFRASFVVDVSRGPLIEQLERLLWNERNDGGGTGTEVSNLTIIGAGNGYLEKRILPSGARVSLFQNTFAVKIIED